MVNFRKELRGSQARRDITTQTARPIYQVIRSPIFATINSSLQDFENLRNK
jgi:hypothetical protein